MPTPKAEARARTIKMAFFVGIVPEPIERHNMLLSCSARLPLTFRPATTEDIAHLVLFADMATRRLVSFLWGVAAVPGQSVCEVGRNVILHDEQHFTHFTNWRVAEYKGRIVGGLNCYVIPDMSGVVASTEVVKPLNELKAIATGTFYISSAAIYPEHQGKGCGKALLTEAETQARSTNHNRLTLMVGSFNGRAHGLYLESGFREWSRRPFAPFIGSDDPGEWILMVKDL